RLAVPVIPEFLLLRYVADDLDALRNVVPARLFQDLVAIGASRRAGDDELVAVAAQEARQDVEVLLRDRRADREQERPLGAIARAVEGGIEVDVAAVMDDEDGLTLRVDVLRQVLRDELRDGDQRV